MRFEPHIWTLDEANAVLPELTRTLRQSREVLADLRTADAQIQDMRLVWGEAGVQEASCPDHDEHEAQMHRALALRAQLRVLLTPLEEMGVVLKDLDQGLVDFHAMCGDQVVFLCWKLGEERVVHWHTLTGGFAARQPVPQIQVTP